MPSTQDNTGKKVHFAIEEGKKKRRKKKKEEKREERIPKNTPKYKHRDKANQPAEVHSTLDEQLSKSIWTLEHPLTPGRHVNIVCVG